jgi:ABC-type multidrug transport system ATPase subunit
MNVEISDVTRRFGRTQAVAGVSLETGPGVFGLLGPNGAGKTTLLRMMATVIPPSSGRMRLLARDPGGTGRGARSGASSVTCRRTWVTIRDSRWPSSSSTSHC